MEKQNSCYHCGESIVNEVVYDQKSFCCDGCKGVYQIINNAGLAAFYQQDGKTQAVGIKAVDRYLDSLKNEKVAHDLLSFKNEEISIVNFILPDIHCASCVWLLERLSTLNPNIVDAQVNFLKKTIRIRFNHHQTTLYDVAKLLQNIGYAPQFYKEGIKQKDKSLIIKIGIAGFVFGNIMLLSFPDYVSDFTDRDLKDFFAYLSIVLVLPVLFYCANIFYKNVYYGFKNKKISIDVPIVLGIFALLTRSLYDIFVLNETGYLDSLSGLIFFLLLGKWFQSKVFDELSFERKAKDYLPLAILKSVKDDFEITALKDIQEGDVVKLRNNEIIPFDGVLLSKQALIDQSFITGEDVPEQKQKSEKLYCGGKVVGNEVLMLVEKINSNDLFSLWQSNQKTQEVSDKLIVAFTYTVVLLGVFTFVFHYFNSGFHNAFIATSSVWIVACPCALALVQPCIWGTFIRKLAKKGIFLKSSKVVDKMKAIQHVVFDKTGTLTGKEYQLTVQEFSPMTAAQKKYIYAIASKAQHPLAGIIQSFFTVYAHKDTNIQLEEFDAEGVIAKTEMGTFKLGKKDFVGVNEESNQQGSLEIWLTLNDELLACFYIHLKDRVGLSEVLSQLNNNYQTYLISGDPNLDENKYSKWIAKANMFKDMLPKAKEAKVNELKKQGGTLMIGDGINDSLALLSADVGLAVVEQNGAFFPQCDGIVMAKSLNYLDKSLRALSKINRIRAYSFAFSILYNSVGFYFAFNLMLNPLIASILMPLSSVTVVLLTVFLVNYALQKT